MDRNALAELLQALESRRDAEERRREERYTALIERGLNTGPIERTLTRLKSSAAHFNRSPTDKCLPEDKQKLLGLKNDNLINDCVTRWNSTYDMICRASEQQAAVAAVIFEKKLSHLELTTNEWMVVENIHETLKPFKTATAALSTDKYPTASAVLPLQHILIKQVKNFAASEIPVIKDMKNKIYSDLSLRYDKEEQQSTFMLLNKTSFFDPRFHRLIHLSEQEKHQVQEEIQTEVIQRFVNETDLVNEHGSSENKEASRKTALTAMGDLFGDTYTCGQEETKNCEIQLMQEMACYVKETPLSADSNPLEWWKKSGLKYPHLAQLAKKYLCVPGTCVRCEHVFDSRKYCK
ncbi:UNVERIFIED_CONTAM: hypothetical protein FKN15_034960 [Acipenser sinensis]